jgi:sporulation protein YlmC with PRC-barrel domain
MAEAPARILTTACALELMRVETSDGVRLGRVFDLRCANAPGQAPTVTAIVYGRRGLLERLGLRHARPTTVPWSSVRAVEERVIVVDLASKAAASR